MSKRQPYYMIKSVEKAFRLIEIISEKKLTRLSDLAQALNITKTNVHRLLLTLKEIGYVNVNDETKRYFLSYKLFSLGCTIPEREVIIEQTYDIMKKLAEVTRETINLAVLKDYNVLYMEKILSPEYLRIDQPIGKNDPCHATALGKVLLAGLSQQEFHQYLEKHNPLQAYTKKTITDPKELMKSVEQVREQGYATDEEELLEGVSCIAIPIWDKKGNTIAAISITVPKVRMGKQRIDKLKNYLLMRK